MCDVDDGSKSNGRKIIHRVVHPSKLAGAFGGASKGLASAIVQGADHVKRLEDFLVGIATSIRRHTTQDF